MYVVLKNALYLHPELRELLQFKHRSGCSSARLEYASGGRVVASSNLVTPTW